jgi:hypothetical protein
MVDETRRCTTCDIVRRSNSCNRYHVRIRGFDSVLKYLEELIMKIAFGAVAVALFAAAVPALAATNLYSTEPAASAACAADEVVWIDLDRGRFYHKNQANFAKGSNGGFACLRVAHAQYREGHE